MIIEAALQLQDGTEQDALQNMGSNMASTSSTEQDTSTTCTGHVTTHVL
jgi:hypothetical protein